MRVFVQVWCELDPTLNVRVDRQTSLPIAEVGDHLHRVSPLGRAGVAAGARLGEVTAFALGAGHDEGLRHAMASGARHAVELSLGGSSETTARPVRRALAEWIKVQAPDLVIADRLAGAVAARLGWSHLAGVDDLHIGAGLLRAVRFLERGDREIVTARLPAAVCLQAEEVRPPYVSRARLRAVAQREIERVVIAGVEASPATGSLQLARPRTKQGALPTTSTSASGRLQALMAGAAPAAPSKKADDAPATVEQMAEEFVRYLLHHNLLWVRSEMVTSEPEA